MTDTPNTPPPPPSTDTPVARFALLDVAGLLDALAVAEEALAGDGSTPHMPDVTPGDAARWMLAALDRAGFVIVRRVTT